jgi:cell division protein FtsQ
VGSFTALRQTHIFGTVTVRIPPAAVPGKPTQPRSIVEAGGSYIGVATHGSNRTRSFVWEDDAPAESRFRRVLQATPSASRGLPFEVDDLDGDEPRKRRSSPPRNPWWRPASTVGRAFLASGLLIVACAFAYAYHECKVFFDHDSRFCISGTGNIQAVGLADVNRSEILSVFGEDIGRNIFFVPLAERRKQLEAIPWIQQATVMRLLPDQLRITVVERQPVAFVRHGQQIGLVDANGVLLNLPAGLMSKHHYSFPVLTGIDAGDPLPSRRARVELYQRLMSELDAGGQHYSDQISEIDLTDPEDARVLMPEQGADVLAHFGEDHFLDRYQRYKAHIVEWRQQYPKLAAVDLRYEQQIVLEMKQDQASAQPILSTEKVARAEAKPVNLPAQSTKPDPAKRASVDPPAPIHAAKKTVVAHAVAVHHASSKKSAKPAMKNAAAKKKDKKHTPTKVVAHKQAQPKPSAKPHTPAPAATGQ